MARYLLFASEQYYPQGGAADLIAALDDPADAFPLVEASDVYAGEAHLLDTETLTIVDAWEKRIGGGEWKQDDWRLAEPITVVRRP